MLVKVASFQNQELGLAARVFADSGKLGAQYRVMFYDLDAGEQLPAVKVFQEHQLKAAKIYAARFCDVAY
jgi:hypothetical protein